MTLIPAILVLLAVIFFILVAIDKLFWAPTNFAIRFYYNIALPVIKFIALIVLITIIYYFFFYDKTDKTNLPKHGSSEWHQDSFLNKKKKNESQIKYSCKFNTEDNFYITVSKKMIQIEIDDKIADFYIYSPKSPIYARNPKYKTVEKIIFDVEREKLAIVFFEEDSGWWIFSSSNETRRIADCNKIS
jgi:hypothetical protein